MLRRIAWVGILGMAAALILAGCGGSAGKVPPEPAQPTAGPYPAPKAPAPPTVTPYPARQVVPPPQSAPKEGRIVPEELWPQGVIQKAVALVAREVGVAEEAVQVRTVEEVQWSDTSLGCPEPGMMYAQVITPGYRIQLEAAGKTFQVHTDRTGKLVRLCGTGR